MKADYHKTAVKHFSRHKGEINCCVFSSDCQILLTCSDDCRLFVWSVISGELLTKASGHTGHQRGVETVCFSPDSKHILSGGWDKRAILWDTQNGTVIRIFSGHQSAIQSSSFSVNSQYLATGSWDYTIKVWNYEAEEKEKTLSGHTGNVSCVCFSTTGLLASGSWDRTVRVWNPHKGAIIFLLECHTGWVRSLAFSRDGMLLASAGDYDPVFLWDMENGNCLKTLQQKMDMAQGCIFSPQGALLTTGMVDEISKADDAEQQ
ncbi:WD repeat-containing protein 38 isoform X4 [Polypterus senegalus]|uniref:WD repeat-containing protein 38 isoform X4 n=1 Tax=Polypterus senegalus TaxID=55291 RepID=UPI001963F004|nr:WD repeat-containing protein 38 isoform X4 [Polypterus senegalus]